MSALNLFQDAKNISLTFCGPDDVAIEGMETKGKKVLAVTMMSFRYGFVRDALNGIIEVFPPNSRYNFLFVFRVGIMKKKACQLYFVILFIMRGAI